MKYILLIEDDEFTSKLIVYTLEKEGYKIVAVPSAEQALEKLQNYCPDIILLDLMLPGMNGYEFSSVFNQNYSFMDSSIIILSSKKSEEDLIFGLNTCADYYITKPFTPQYLAASVNAVLRKRRRKYEKPSLPGLEINFDTKTISVNGRTSVLTPTEFKLFYYLIQNNSSVCSRDEIISKVYGNDYHITHRTVDFHICNLRKKLGDLGRFLKSYPGSGYQINSSQD